MDWKAKSLRPGVALAISAAGLMSASAAGQVTLNCSANNATSLVPAPGERVTISIDLEGEDTDFYTSVVFRVVFTAPGMAIEEYLFAGPFDTGTWLDGSLPGVESLPATIDEAMLEGPMWPIETSDMLFDNFLLSGFATPGSLLEFEISIPKDFPTGDSVYVVAVPEEIADGFDILDAESGTVLELFVDVARPEDLNRDGMVDGADLGLFVSFWGPLGELPDGIRTPDFNADGTVNGSDLGAMLSAWG
jgi:hypothetical protein